MLSFLPPAGFHCLIFVSSNDQRFCGKEIKAKKKNHVFGKVKLQASFFYFSGEKMEGEGAETKKEE